MWTNAVEFRFRWILAATILLVSLDSGVTTAQQGNAARPVEVHSLATSQSDTKENLATLSLVSNRLHQAKPILGEKAEFPDFTRELIQLQWRTGDPIDLYVILPRGVKKARAIVYLYSYPSESERFIDNDYCRRLVKGEFAAIGFVSALTGQRYHDRPMKEWFVSALEESLVTSVHDVQMILDYLATRGDIDVSRVGFFGQGSGATIAILAASVDPRIKALDLLEPWGDWPDWLAQSSLVPEDERSSYLKPGFLARIAPLDPVKSLPGLNTQASRLQLVADNAVTPPTARERIASAAPHSMLVVRYQDTRSLYDATTGGRLFVWVKEALTAVSEPPHNPVDRAGPVDIGRQVRASD